MVLDQAQQMTNQLPTRNQAIKILQMWLKEIIRQLLKSVSLEFLSSTSLLQGNTQLVSIHTKKVRGNGFFIG